MDINILGHKIGECETYTATSETTILFEYVTLNDKGQAIFAGANTPLNHLEIDFMSGQVLSYEEPDGSDDPAEIAATWNHLFSED